MSNHIMAFISDLELDALIDEYCSERENAIALFDSFATEVDEQELLHLIALVDKFAQEESESTLDDLVTEQSLSLQHARAWVSPLVTISAKPQVLATHGYAVTSEMLKQSDEGVWVYTCVSEIRHNKIKTLK